MIIVRPNLAIYCKLLCVYSFKFDMPKYAVAVGKKVGIFGTWKECQAQVVGFPNAKYKKFETNEEAEKFIEQFSQKADVLDGPVYPENIRRPETFRIEKVSPSDPLNNICLRLSSVEEQMRKVVGDVNSKLEHLSHLFPQKMSLMNFSEETPDVRSSADATNNVCLRLCSLENAISTLGVQVNSKLDNLMMIVGKKRAGEGFENDVSAKKIKTEPSQKEDLIKSLNGSVIVYTDGACSSNGRTGAKAGVGVWFNHNHHLNVSAPVKGPPTNNTAEIQAARIAIEQALKADIKELSIHTDSKFVINCITQWIHRWKKNDWTLSNGGKVKNKEELIKLDKAVKKLKLVEWNYVAGHRGVEGNEMADRLARLGAEQYSSNITFGKDSQYSDLDD